MLKQPIVGKAQWTATTTLRIEDITVNIIGQFSCPENSQEDHNTTILRIEDVTVTKIGQVSCPEDSQEDHSTTTLRIEDVNMAKIGQVASPEDSQEDHNTTTCLLYTSPSPRDLSTSRMPSSA